MPPSHYNESPPPPIFPGSSPTLQCQLCPTGFLPLGMRIQQCCLLSVIPFPLPTHPHPAFIPPSSSHASQLNLSLNPKAPSCAACEHIHHDGEGVPEGPGAPQAAGKAWPVHLAVRTRRVAAHRGGGRHSAPHLLVVHPGIRTETQAGCGGLTCVAVTVELCHLRGERGFLLRVIFVCQRWPTNPSSGRGRQGCSARQSVLCLR